MITNSKRSAIFAMAMTLGLGISETQAAPATTSAPQAPPPISSTEQWIKDVKNPAPWLSWGSDLRLRNEYLNNAISLSDAAGNHEQDLFRIRGRVWSSVTPVTNLSFFARLSAEPRDFMKPAGFGSRGGRTGMEWRYGLLDNVNLKLDNIGGQPLSIKAGRQDILLGDYYDWWLVADGTPRDGSWSLYFDSVRLDYDAKPINTKFNAIYIYQNANPDEWVPTLNSPTDTVTEQNEQGVILYASNKSLKNMTLDGYFIYKRDNQYQGKGDNADIYTLGGKITGTPADHWLYSVEGAYQFGRKQDTISGTFAQRDIDAYGGKAKLSYLFKDRLNNQVSLVGEFLSGDNKNTGNDEMFDVLWGRWPRWSELYIYSYVYETSGKIAQMNNVGRIGAQLEHQSHQAGDLQRDV